MKKKLWIIVAPVSVIAFLSAMVPGHTSALYTRYRVAVWLIDFVTTGCLPA